MILRRGMWAVDGGDVGIIADIMEDGSAEFHVVDGDGITVGVRQATAKVRQAKFKEIPEARRPDVKIAARFGYE